MKIKASNFNKLMILTGNRFIELEIIDIHVDFLNIILINFKFVSYKKLYLNPIQHEVEPWAHGSTFL